jgi:hypothetical protein
VPLQQPFGQEVTSQAHWPMPVLQSCPDPHAWHAAPPEPHDDFVSLPRGTHVEPLQQPEQEPPPQVHAPPEHDCPAPQGLHAAPAAPHSEFDCEP